MLAGPVGLWPLVCVPVAGTQGLVGAWAGAPPQLSRGGWDAEGEARTCRWGSGQLCDLGQVPWTLWAVDPPSEV